MSSSENNILHTESNTVTLDSLGNLSERDFKAALRDFRRDLSEKSRAFRRDILEETRYLRRDFAEKARYLKRSKRDTSINGFEVKIQTLKSEIESEILKIKSKTDIMQSQFSSEIEIYTTFAAQKSLTLDPQVSSEIASINEAMEAAFRSEDQNSSSTTKLIVDLERDLSECTIPAYFN